MGQRKNPDPDTSGLVKWRPGESGNPAGNSTEAWAVRRRNAEKIVAAQAILSEALLKKATELSQGEDTQALIDALIRADITNFSREVMDRGFGKAQGSLDLTSSDGSASAPTTIRLIAAKEDDGTDD